MVHATARFIDVLLPLVLLVASLTREPTRAEHRRQRQRRRTLWLASVGIDAGPRRIHGVRVRAW